MIWIIHGYDYLNPDNPLVTDLFSLRGFCRADLKARGFTDHIIDTEFSFGLMDSYNERLLSISQEHPDIRYIDLRTILGGPPTSGSAFLFDCIHPNEAGFALLSNVYVYQLDNFTGGVR